MKLFFLFFLFFLAFFSCKKNEYPDPEPLPSLDSAGFLNININNVVNNTPLILNTTEYTNANNDTFTVDIYKYYISNVQLRTNTGVVNIEPDSYYLIDQQKPNSLNLLIKRVAFQDYSSISFNVGVDSARNIYGSFTGALDPANDMYWGWNQGFIMAKLEGHSRQSAEPTQKIVYHIGGYAGKFNGVRTVNLSFPNIAIVKYNHTPTLNLKADLATWFSYPTPLDFSQDWGITGIAAESSNIADNYANMFTVTSVIN
ncbi:MAG: MbnP family protein [Bacteroidota bacterium]